MSCRIPQKGDEETVSVDDDEVQQAILTGYYNAVMIYLKVANETLAKHKNLSDGAEIVRSISNRTFEGQLCRMDNRYM